MARPSGRDIRREVIESATRAIQARGATAFSYATIAEELGIKAPSIHHHFPRKADLLAAAVAEHRTRFAEHVDQLDATSARQRLEAYADLFLAPAQRGLLCLCGAATAGWKDLDRATRAEVTSFFDREIAWVAAQAAAGVDSGELRADLDTSAFATAFIATLEGALLLARASSDRATGSATASFLLDQAAHTGPSGGCSAGPS